MNPKPRKILESLPLVEDKLGEAKRYDESSPLKTLLLLRESGNAPPRDAMSLGEKRIHQREHVDHDEMLPRSRASDADLETVRNFAAEYGLEAHEEQPGSRTISLTGMAKDFEKAFEVELIDIVKHGKRVYTHKGPISVPAELGEIVIAVFGLDNRFTAEKPSKGKVPVPEIDEHTKPPQIFRQLYEFPENATGAGQCIAILEFAGGFHQHKLKEYMDELGSPAPEVVVKEIGRGKNNPVDQAKMINDDVEVYMDIEIASSVAPDAKIVVYFGENTELGWIETINAAVLDSENRPDVISISWGQAESKWSTPLINALEEAFTKAAHLGITVCCSSGDFGVYERSWRNEPMPFTVAYPASSPHVLTCGGTRTTTAGDSIVHEAVWNESDPPVGRTSGGGVSRLLSLPPYQSGAGVPHYAMQRPGRGLPDVAANASTRSGFKVLSDDTEMSMGGTSAAAPLWAGLVACLNEALGRNIGFLTPLLYTADAQSAGVLRDVVNGDNKNRMYDDAHGYEARPGWDACTGLGTPRGKDLLHWLQN